MTYAEQVAELVTALRAAGATEYVGPIGEGGPVVTLRVAPSARAIASNGTPMRNDPPPPTDDEILEGMLSPPSRSDGAAT